MLISNFFEYFFEIHTAYVYLRLVNVIAREVEHLVYGVKSIKSDCNSLKKGLKVKFYDIFLNSTFELYY